MDGQLRRIPVYRDSQPAPLHSTPVLQWVLSLSIPLRLLLAAQPKLVMLVPQVVHRVIKSWADGRNCAPAPTTHEQFSAFVKAELAKHGPVVKV